MASADKKAQGTRPTSSTGHPLPRRASPANSVTLRHRKPHDASPPIKPALSRRISSNESHETGQSDPKRWFDQSNENPTATFGNNAMDIDPPFFQKESSDEKPFAYNAHLPIPKAAVPQSSSADDYRSVIDDLTVEIQRLKEELKWYKQSGPDMLKKEKLFEIKVHGLPNPKKRELEATLRDFATGLGSSPSGSTSHRTKKSSRPATRDHMYSTSGSMSKHAPSSSGSRFRLADSAYASMSTGDKSGTSLARPMMVQSRDANEKKVESYLRDIPAGLYPRHTIMSERERKKLVVRRLEQLFTGKIAGRHGQKNQTGTAPIGIKAQPQISATPSYPLSIKPEAAREAKILPSEQQSGQSGKKSQSRDVGSSSNSHGDQTESGGNGTSSGANLSPPLLPPPVPEQRPTRPRDLDPDRTQIPSENMDYIRHLGLIPPELLAERSMEAESVHPDADGWVYLNLLCSLAQLHIINVTPEFVRVAVSEYSSKFQLSPDGRKIRWRGGSQGTKFSSDSSGYTSQQSPSTCDTDDSDKKLRKRQKVVRSAGDDSRGGSLGKKASKSMFGAQDSGSFESFHYKPILIHRESSTSMEGTLSSPGPPEESNADDSRWGMSGSYTSNRRKRRHDGAIIYYSGAPFCTDLSGDPGDISPQSYMLTASQTTHDPRQPPLFSSPPRRTYSGSFINDRPLSDRGPFLQTNTELTLENVTNLVFDDSEELSDAELDLVWSAEKQRTRPRLLEPCGLGGVLPDDHFMVAVTTKRPKQDAMSVDISHQQRDADDIPNAIIRRLASMSTSSQKFYVAKTSPHHKTRSVGIEYVSGSIKRLKPVSLPPPAMFVPPFSTDGSSEEETTASDSSVDLESSRELMSQVANPHNDYPDGVDLSSGDEDGEDPDDSPGDHNMYDFKSDGEAQAYRAKIDPTNDKGTTLL
ncbi:frequency clock protein [Dactylonectria estremocensis]|uniref:Frequency clock protein n=1 Tax=Dactylonectria estremocensis TaxID=1079267 RepID=A0A9P9F700_9HYPO|nr:frequency clock protein [Dactylonectria estremocensis]